MVLEIIKQSTTATLHILNNATDKKNKVFSFLVKVNTHNRVVCICIESVFEFKCVQGRHIYRGVQ